MSTFQDLGPRIRTWLHGRLSERPDPYPILDEVLSQLPTTPQRRHRWWPFGAPTWKAKTMYSTIKFVAAGAVVALFGGFLLSASLITQPGDETIPGADTGSPASHEAAVFDGTMPYPNQYLAGTTPVLEGGMLTKRGAGYQTRVEDISDPRLAGTWRTIVNEDAYITASGVRTATRRIDNVKGSWLGHLTGYRDPHSGGRWYHQGILAGSGAYEGLTAIVFQQDTGAMGYDVHGMIFPGDLPEAPGYPEPAE